jgi:tetratricopeptide (TPR) repeat protein
MFEHVIGKSIVQEICGSPFARRERPEYRSGKQLDSREAIRNHEALKVKGQYGDCARIATTMLTQAREAADAPGILNWAAKLASDFRLMGDLQASIQYAEEAITAYHSLSTEELAEPELKLAVLKFKFGRTVSLTTMSRGDFKMGLQEHLAHEEMARSIARSNIAPIRKEATLYLGHIRRQRAECTRYLGRYSEALQMARRCEKFYKPADTQPRLWARGYQADSLRLLGKVTDAGAMLSELIDDAELLKLADASITFRWRRASMALLAGVESGAPDISKLREAVGQPIQSRWAQFYAHIVLATATLNRRGESTAHLRQATALSPVTSTDRRLEFGYLRLVEGELYRQHAAPALAKGSYRSALEAFEQMGVVWGEIRARVGLALLGESNALSRRFESLEGLDRKLWEAVIRGSTPEPGQLCFNVP